MRVYRVQDAQGRGPFRPGLPALWADETFAPGMNALPTWGDEFGWDLVERLGRPGEYFGSAVRDTASIGKWFSTAEQHRLRQLGFSAVSLRVQRVLAESENQLVFARRAPLHAGALIVPFPNIEAAA